jgi:hypothetical protein
MKKLRILAVATLMLVGCSLVDRQMESWMGHHQSELIANWGPPQQVMDDGQGGKIFIYSATQNYTSPGRATTNVTGSAYNIGDYTYGNATGAIRLTHPLKRHRTPPTECSGLTVAVMFTDGHGEDFKSERDNQISSVILPLRWCKS